MYFSFIGSKNKIRALPLLLLPQPCRAAMAARSMSCARLWSAAARRRASESTPTTAASSAFVPSSEQIRPTAFVRFFTIIIIAFIRVIVDSLQPTQPRRLSDEEKRLVPTKFRHIRQKASYGSFGRRCRLARCFVVQLKKRSICRMSHLLFSSLVPSFHYYCRFIIRQMSKEVSEEERANCFRIQQTF